MESAKQAQQLPKLLYSIKMVCYTHFHMDFLIYFCPLDPGKKLRKIALSSGDQREKTCWIEL